MNKFEANEYKNLINGNLLAVVDISTAKNKQKKRFKATRQTNEPKKANVLHKVDASIKNQIGTNMYECNALESSLKKKRFYDKHKK